jgi:hypothetical protein
MSNAPMGESRKPERKLTSGRGFARLNGGSTPREVMCVSGAKHERFRSSRSSPGVGSVTSRVVLKFGPAYSYAKCARSFSGCRRRLA